MTLLEEAADEYRKARADNEARDKLTAETLPPDHALRLEIRSERLEIARGLSVLAAIEAGLPPCCCTGHHGPERETT